MKPFIDKIVADARTKCINAAGIPRSILRRYRTRIVAGKLILGEKK